MRWVVPGVKKEVDILEMDGRGEFWIAVRAEGEKVVCWIEGRGGCGLVCVMAAQR